MKTIDLNVDISEGFPYDRELLKFATSANVCCGAHAGSAELSHETAILCQAMGVRIGAHPGYPDRENFGRLSWSDHEAMESGALFHSLVEQVNSLGTPVAYIKPHGALYNDSCTAGPAATLVASLISRFHAPLMGLPGTFHERIAEAAGFGFVREGFADRRTLADGRLAPRSEPGAVITDPDEACRQAVSLAGHVDSVCLHGDGERAVELARAVRSALEQAGYEVRA